MLIDHTLFGVINKVEQSIARIKQFEPPEGYYLAFSGGKDSIVLYDLVIRAEVKFDAHFMVTTVDPPELLRFIKDRYPEVEWHHPERNMWQLIERKKTPPFRISRYCCEQLKETGGKGRKVLTGIRWEESSRRNARIVVESCAKSPGKIYISPILDWLEEDIWAFINTTTLKYCQLYDEGFKRIGCIGCPMGNIKQREKQFERWPKFKQLYLRAFDKMLVNRINSGLPTTWKSGQEVFDWWMEK